MNGIGGHVFCISDNSLTKVIWGYAQTVGTQREVTSLRAEHGGALGILLVLYNMYIFYQEVFPHNLSVYIDNSEVICRGQEKVPRLGIKQQLVFDYDLWVTTEWLQEVLPCII